MELNNYFLDLIAPINWPYDYFSEYSILLSILWNTKFIVVIDEDESRIEDAYSLRQELAGPEDKPISVLEVLIALAKRCHEDIMDGSMVDGQPSSISYWFWLMIQNCGLNQYPDYLYFDEEVIRAKLDDIIFRRYDYDGTGGFFPLRRPEMDQRFCELWSQMNAYLVENYAN